MSLGSLWKPGINQPSIIPPWFKWVALAIALIAIVVAVYAYGEKQHARGLDAGTNACKVECQANNNTELIAANAEIIRLQKQANDDEALHQQRIAKIVDYLQELNTNEKAKSDAVIRDLAAGNAKLQFALKKGATIATASQASAGGTSQARASTGSGDEETTGELPPEIGADLYAEADRADEITEQLNACQQVVTEDRRVCGAKPELKQE